jgi:cell filamentation protein
MDQVHLHRTESRVALLSAARFRKVPLPKQIDEARLKVTHHAIFHRLYPFAGEYRQNTGTMTKGRMAGYQVTYGDSRFVPAEMTRIFAALKNERYLRGLERDAFAARLAFYYSEMDATHPFREGNSRTLRQFTTDLARVAGYVLDWTPAGRDDASRNALYRARDMAAHGGNLGLLTSLVATLIAPLPV